MRKNIYELLEEMGCDPKGEYARLYESIFTRKHYSHTTWATETISACIDKYCFGKIPLHGSFLDINDMMESLFYTNPANNNSYKDLDKLAQNLFITNSESDFDKLFLLCELIIGIWEQGKSYISVDKDIYEQMSIVVDNIKYTLGKTNHKLIKDHDGNLIIVENSKTATQAAEIAENSETAFKILEYNHYNIKGNLEQKKAILRSIGHYVEPIIKDKTFSEGTYKALSNDARYLLNNFDIRHNNTEGQSKNEFIEKMSNAVLEEWYDKTYNTLLMAIIAKEQIKISNAIKDVKK